MGGISLRGLIRASKARVATSKSPKIGKKTIAEAQSGKESPQAPKPDSFVSHVSSHHAFMGGSHSGIKTDPITGRRIDPEKQATTEKPLAETKKRRSWSFNSSKSDSETSSLKSRASMESFRSGWKDKSPTQPDTAITTPESGRTSVSHSPGDATPASIASSRTSYSTASNRSAGVDSTISSNNSARSTGLGGYFPSKWARKSQPSVETKGTTVANSADPFTEIRNLHSQEMTRLKGANGYSPSNTSTLRDEPAGKSDFKDPSTTSSQPHGDSKSVDTSQKGLSPEEEEKWDQLSDKYFDKTITPDEQKELNELNNRSPRGVDVY
jgi:hypothetical protein